MHKRFLAIAGLIVAIAAGPAFAHPTNPGQDCDTWNRTGHGTPSDHDSDAADIDNLNDVVFAAPSTPLPVYLHRETGHYVLRNGTGSDMSYVEVVGGGQYTGGTDVPKMGEGGYVEGRVSAGGQNEVDFHVDFFGPIREPAPQLIWSTSGDVCVSVGTTKVAPGRVTIVCPPPTGMCH